VQFVFLLAGFLLLGYYGYVQTDTYLFQAYQSWRLDQLQRGKPATMVLYLKQWLPKSGDENVPGPEGSQPLGISPETAESKAPNSETPPPANPGSNPEPAPGANPVAPEGSLIGRILIPRLDLSAIILEGVQTKTLRLAVGHLPGTPLPGQSGNVELAAHRDTFFRGLRNVKKGDVITLSTVRGATYDYRVESLAVVSPNNTDILSTFPGPGVNLITCYPFSYVGPAPKRFVVHAVEVNDSASDIKGAPGNSKGNVEADQSSLILPAGFAQQTSPARARKPRNRNRKTARRYQHNSKSDAGGSPGQASPNKGGDSSSLAKREAGPAPYPENVKNSPRPRVNRFRMIFQKIFPGSKGARQVTPSQASQGS
jgi:sortase A